MTNIDGTSLTSRLLSEPIHPVPKKDRQKAARYVLCNSDDATEAQEFLEMLGLEGVLDGPQ